MEENDYVSHELAVKLKAANFDLKCPGVWHFDGEDWDFIENYGATFIHPAEIPHWNTTNTWGARIYSAPTLYHAQKWLREVKGIAINVIAHDGGKYHWTEVFLPNFNDEECRWADYLYYCKHPLVATYEEALSDGLNKMCNLLLGKEVEK